MDVTLSHLRSLVAVVDHGSFTDAAAHLGVSQSAVSHALSSFERVVGGPVIRRGGEGELTSRGERIVAHARSVLASVTALEASVAQDDASQGTVRLGAVATVCQGLLPELLSRWSRELPHVEIQIYEGDDDELLEWLDAGVVDIAVVVDPEAVPDGGVLVATDEYCAVLPVEHPLAGECEIPLAELLVDGLIVSGGGCEAQVIRMYAAEGLTYTYRHRVREISTLFRMVEQGLGAAVVPSLGRDMLPDSLVMAPLVPRQPRPLVLMGPPSRSWHPLAQALIDTV